MKFSTWRVLPLLVALLMLIGVNQVGATRDFSDTAAFERQTKPAMVAPNFYKFKQAGKSQY